MDVDADSRASRDNLGWGKSLPVDSVQELVRRDPYFIPDRYIRDKITTRKDAEDSLSSSIPIIDFSLLSNGDEAERRKLDSACKEWGFFQIINHRIDEALLKRTKEAVAAFFELPLKRKQKYAMAPDDLHGYGHAFVVSEEQKLDWNDLVYLITLPPEIRKPNYWPLEIPNFKNTIEEYALEIQRVSFDLLANLPLLMNMDRNELLQLHGGARQGMRMNYYPICSKPDQVLGLSPHSDASSITILFQDEDVTGLQIKHKGEWVTVKPSANALIRQHWRFN